MIDCQKIKALAEQQLVGTDVFVVSCKVSPSNEVELLLDSDTSVQLETCAAVNRASQYSQPCVSSRLSSSHSRPARW